MSHPDPNVSIYNSISYKLIAATPYGHLLMLYRLQEAGTSKLLVNRFVLLPNACIDKAVLL